MLDICDDLGLTCRDLLPDFQGYALAGEHLYYTDDMHLNPRGNLVMAEVIQTWLDELGWLGQPTTP
jgi:lysophospholipase L1-like esterase